ncbi:MAG: hypothetical protein ACRD32_02365, partial [Nitrososphaerales archaeon]
SGAFSSVGASPTAPAAVDNQPMVMHIHPNLTIKIDGKSVMIPANVGIEPSLYKDHMLDTYGMKMPNMSSMPVMAPTHTHDSSGIIHVESSVVRDYTLGEFFNVWGVTFTSTCIMDKCNDGTKTVKIFVNGQPSFEFRNYAMKDGDEIVIQYD